MSSGRMVAAVQAARPSHSSQTLRALRGSLPLTLGELTEHTGLSRPTVLTALDGLTEKGWVDVLEPGHITARGAGRPAKRYAFRSDAGVVAGVDVGVHSVLVLLADLDGGVSSQHRVSLHSNLSAAGRVDAVVRTIEEALAESGSPTLIAVGVGAPGVIDHAGRVRVCPPIREWDGIDLSTQLEQRLGCTVRIENDAMAAAEGENRYGAGRGTQNFVYLLAGHRITTASFINGRLHRGYNGAAGMVGEIEALRWERAPARLVDAFAGDGNTVSLAAEGIFRLAVAGQPEAEAAVDRYLDDVAFGLAATVLAVDPELVIVGGGISLAGLDIAASLRPKLAAHAKIVNPRVETSVLGNRATALGAVSNALAFVDHDLLGLT